MSKIANLFVLLKEKNISHTELSKIIGVSTGNISDWKSGRSAPTYDKLLEISELLGVSTDYLLGKTDEKNKPTNYGELTDEQKTWIKFFEGLSILLRKAGQGKENVIKKLMYGLMRGLFLLKQDYQ